MEEKNRIEKIIEYLGLNSGQFAGEIDITAPALSHILNGRNNPSLDVMKKILERYPEISPEWLILGEGTMLRKISDSQEPSLFDDFDITNKNTEGYLPKKIDIVDTQPSTKEKQLAQDGKKASEITSVSTQQVTISATSKKIERIIVYFDDKTYQEFKLVES